MYASVYGFLYVWRPLDETTDTTGRQRSEEPAIQFFVHWTAALPTDTSCGTYRSEYLDCRRSRRAWILASGLRASPHLKQTPGKLQDFGQSSGIHKRYIR